MPLLRAKYVFGVMAGLGALVFVMLMRMGFTFTDDGWRDTNRYEVFYHQVAYLVDEPELCSKISLKAVRSGGFNPRGSQIKYVRSQCYRDVAVQHNHPELCDRIKPLSTFFMTGHNLSPSSCLGDIQEKQAGSSRDQFNGYPVHNEDYIRIFSEMGYEPDTIHLELPVSSVINKKSEYRQLAEKPDITQRLAAVIKTRQAYGSRQPVDAIDREILADMLATLTNDANVCKLIREDTIIPESGSGENHTFRNWCIFKIAARTSRIDLCEQMTNRVPDLEFPWETLKHSCRSQVKSHPKPAPRYNYFVPKKEMVVHRLMSTLGYGFSDPASVPPEKIADRYRGIIRDIARQPELKQDARVQRLITKIRALPDFVD